MNIAAQPTFPAQARPAPAQQPDDRTVYIAAILMYVMLLPPQLNITLLGATFPPYRFFIIGASLLIFTSGLSGRLKLVLPDYFLLFAVGWIWLSFYMNVGFSEFAIPAGGQTVDVGLSYFLARAAFRTPRDLRLFLLLVVPGLAVVGGILVVESITHTNYLQPFIAELTGKTRARWPQDERMGLMRARGSLAHPILAGIFFASFLPLYWLSGLRGWPRILGIAASFASFFTVSSAALLALTLGGSLIAYNWLTERITNLTWRLLFIISAVFIFVTELGTESGSFNLIMRYGSLNSASAFNRVLIWRYGSENVKQNPWFGIGYAEWERPAWLGNSLDHYWLLQAIQVGLIPPTLIALATALAVIALLRGSRHLNPADQGALRALAMAMSVFALGVISVAVWLSTQVWFHMMIGICVSLGYNAIAAQKQHYLRAVQAPRANPFAARPTAR